MRTVYYIIGPTCSGKTTASKKLALRMELPLFHADLVYDQLHRNLGLDGPADQLINADRWNDPANYGLASWGDYPTMWEAKAPIMKDMLGDVEGDFIIEGFTLSYPEERFLVTRAIGVHRGILLRLDQPQDGWERFYVKRNGIKPHPGNYERLRSAFKTMPKDTVYTFRDPNLVDVHYAPYQKEGFTDKKIAALKIPIQSGDVVNDIGCNEGLIGKWCVDQGASIAHGYDSNWRFLDKARENGLVVHLGNVEHDPMQVADVTLCVSVFHYFENPQAFIRKARSVTRRLFVLELPIMQDAETKKPTSGLLSKFEPAGVNFEVTRYSAALIELWLKKSFASVEFVGVSVPPDNSLRHVYHCWV